MKRYKTWDIQVMTFFWEHVAVMWLVDTVVQIPALSNFCKLVEMLWADPVSFIWHGDHRRNDDICDSGPKIARLSKPSCYVRNIISGVELDIVLVGSLKVCVGKLSHDLRSAVVDYTAPCMRIIEAR